MRVLRLVFVSVIFIFSLTLSDTESQSEIGNVIFIHPDGTSLNHWNAGRMYWAGSDAQLNWDTLPQIAIYRGHLTDALTSTSNGAATTHAFGYKVGAESSYGRDDERPIRALSGFEGSIMREASSQGYPVGILNDGIVSEPGTSAFLAEVDNRNFNQRIVAQLLDGRGSDYDDPLPVIILGGGERYFLPEDTPYCEETITPDCAVHRDVLGDDEPTRDDGRNLIQEATDQGFVVIRTRSEYEALREQLAADPTYAPSVLGLFAANAIFNAAPEEKLIEEGLVDNSLIETKSGRLLLWGSEEGTAGYLPPTSAELMALSLDILERHSQISSKPFFLVAETESNDNFSNDANSIGMLNALKRADDMIGVAQTFLIDNPDTLILTAADSDAGAPQVFSPPAQNDDGEVTESRGHPTGVSSVDPDNGYPLDGIEGYETMPFLSAPDAFGNQLPFAIGWAGTDDVAGAVIARADGLNAGVLRNEFNSVLDNTDVYRLIYLTLFGELLPPATGKQAPSR